VHIEKLCKVATVCAMLHNIAIDSDVPPPLFYIDEDGDEEEVEIPRPNMIHIRRNYILNNLM